MYCTDVLLPRTIGGSDSTYFSDYYWGTNKLIGYPFFGGYWVDTYTGGVFAINNEWEFNFSGITVGSLYYSTGEIILMLVTLHFVVIGMILDILDYWQ